MYILKPSILSTKVIVCFLRVSAALPCPALSVWCCATMAFTGMSAEVTETRAAQDVAGENGNLDNLANDLRYAKRQKWAKWLSKELWDYAYSPSSPGLPVTAG